MTGSAHRPVLLVQHVDWEDPHRLGAALGELPSLRVSPLDRQPLPPVESVCGAVFMGGPMSVHDVDAFPALAREVEWLAEAVREELPVIGVCLGAQLLARALGAEVCPAEIKELGWAPIEVLDPLDPLIGPLAPATTVLHWHGEVFEPPGGADVLARSAHAAVQAFRAGRCAWGLLFHAEADGELVERWLAEPSMAAEAEQTLGLDYARQLRHGAAEAEAALRRTSAPGFESFAALCAERDRG